MKDGPNKDTATIEVSLGRPCILIIDDDEDFLESARELFSARGFDVDTAATPEAATKILKGNRNDKYQVVATDTFFDTLSHIKGDEFVLENPSLFGRAKTVVITGGDWLTFERRQKLENAGVSLLEKSPTLVKKLEEITETENQKQAKEISMVIAKETAPRVQQLTGRSVDVTVVSGLPRSTSALSDVMIGRLKGTLVSWLKSRTDLDSPILAYGQTVYSANEMADEVPKETMVGLAHVTMLLKEFEYSLKIDRDN
jgi:FixJ family two-component response regulator